MRRTTALTILAAVCLVATTAGVSRAASPSSVTSVPCGPEVFPGFECGTVDVPVDRHDAGRGSIALAFQLFRHWDDTTPARGTIVTSVGGPGTSNTFFSGFWLFKFLPLLDHRDLLVIDHRGMGQSSAIDCPGLQHFAGDLRGATLECAALLGSASDRYGSGDVADDIDDVRAALGIDKIDYYGDSYGAVDVRAYAYRHASHLRSAVLDSPFLTEDWTFQRATPRFTARVQAAVCRQSPSCGSANSDPEGTLSWLAGKLRKQPVDGVGYDADGNPHPVHVDEATLIDILSNGHYSDPAYLGQGELTAAAEALRRGDPTPLLRLAAENQPATEAGDAAGLQSIGAATAIFCADGRFAWDASASRAQRGEQFQSALAALPGDAFAPFSASAWLTALARQPNGPYGGVPAEKCLDWPAPTRPDPPYPENQQFPATVPVLLLTGGLDVLPADEVQAALHLFPPGTPFVRVTNSGHVTLWWNDCAQAIILTFIDTLATGDTSCAESTATPMHQPFGAATGKLQLQGVGRFPAQAEQAIPAERVAGSSDASTPSDRRVAAVAWSAVEDATLRALRMSGSNGRGLRGGSFGVARGDTAIDLDLAGLRFTNDVQVSGRAKLDLATSSLDATVSIEGPGGHDGTLALHGILWDPDQPTATIRGSLRGRTIEVTAPAG